MRKFIILIVIFLSGFFLGHAFAVELFALTPENSNPTGITYDFNSENYFVVDSAQSMVFVYDSEFIYLPDDSFSLDPLNSNASGIVFEFGYIFIPDADSYNVFAYDQFGTREPIQDFSLPGLVQNPVGITTFENHFYILGEFGQVYCFNLFGTRVSDREFNIEFLDPNLDSIDQTDSLFYFGSSTSNVLFAVSSLGEPVPDGDIIMGPGQISNALSNNALGILSVDGPFRAVNLFPIPNFLDPVTTLSFFSDQPTSILLSWLTPSAVPPIIGYQVNFTTPFSNNPEIILSQNTGNTQTTALITGLEVSTPYSFRVGTINANGINASGNVVNGTTLYALEIGNSDISATNPDKTNLYFQTNTFNDQSEINIVYNKNWDLRCHYDVRYGTQNNTIQTPAFPFDDFYNISSVTFLNLTSSDITLSCADAISGESHFTHVGSYTNFLIADQVRDFQNGKYGTNGMLGFLDLFTVVVIIVAMMGFNHKNEAVGLIVSLFIISLAILFGLLTFPALLFPVVALVIMVVISSTKKD